MSENTVFKVVESEIIGARLKDIRVKSGLKVNALAGIVGISGGTISDLENGKTYPSHQSMCRYRFFFPKHNWNSIFFKV